MFLGSILNGVSTGWLAPVLKHSQDPKYDITLTSDQCAWISAIQEPARICGLVSTVLLVDLIGRSKIYILTSLLNLSAWLIVRLTKSVTLLYISRFCFGVSLGMIEVASSIYVGENSLPQLRGIISSYDIMFFYLGLVVEFVLVTYLSYSTVATVNVVLAFVFLSSNLLSRETPQYLITKGADEKAAKNFRWLLSPDKREFEMMKEGVRANTETSLNVTEFFSTRAYYKSFSIIVILRSMTAMCGFWTLLPFLSIAFASSDLLSPNEFTICYGLIQFLSLFVSTLFVERFDRRTIMLTAIAAGSLMHASTAILYYVQENISSIPNFPWLIFITISSYSAIYASGVAPLTNVLRAEMFPHKIKAMGNCSASLAGSAGIFVTSILFLKIAQKFGIFVNFLFFSTVCLLIFVFVYTWVPETRGKSLIEIQEMLGKSDSSCNEAPEVEVRSNRSYGSRNA